MSNIQFGSFGQAARVLDILSEQKLSTQEIEILGSGFLSDLARAVKLGTVPARDAFQKFLGLLPELKVWKTVRLGLRKSVVEYEEALSPKTGLLRLGVYARKILKKITVSQTVVEVDLCVMSVAELGFKSGARYDAICERIAEIGGELCPAEVGPALCLQYKDQPSGEWNLIAMEAIPDSDGNLLVFVVEHDRDGRWLDSYGGRPSYVYDSGARFVFVVPRKLES